MRKSRSLIISKSLTEQSLRYHREPKPGKLEITATNSMATQADLAKAYSPGVAHACELIEKDPSEAANLTAQGNLVGVISNGTSSGREHGPTRVSN